MSSPQTEITELRTQIEELLRACQNWELVTAEAEALVLHLEAVIERLRFQLGMELHK